MPKKLWNSVQKLLNFIFVENNIKIMNHVVIMAGGIGSRFWPLSTPEYPKQFIDILGCGRTLIQMTVDRFKGICSNTNFWVVTNEKYVSIVREQIPTIPASHILAEPAARNTAPCVAWACWEIRKEDSNANIVVTPSDAVVMNPMEFQRVISNALNFTSNRNAIVTIGMKPNRPETGYGTFRQQMLLKERFTRWKPSRRNPTSKPQNNISKLATIYGMLASSCFMSTPW